MKNKLFRSLLILMVIVFGLTLAMCLYFFEISITKSYIGLIALLAFFIIFIPLVANYTAHYIIDDSLKPVSSFLKYITDILISENYDKSMIDEELENEVLDYLVKYGHNSDSVKLALDRVKQAQTIRKEFSANVTHELKSPLTSINGYAEMIAGGMTNLEQAQEFSKIILHEGNRLLNMIDETIQLSKFDNNYVMTERQNMFSISEKVEENINALKAFAEQKGIEINYNTSDILFYGNERLIDDMIRNLISNAIKYSKEKDGFVNISLTDDMKNIYFSVKDNGIGISDEDQKRVFERFYVVNKSRDRKTGTGLGLSLVKNIANMHNGSIDLISDLGQGSEFIVTLPKTNIPS